MDARLHAPSLLTRAEANLSGTGSLYVLNVVRSKLADGSDRVDFQATSSTCGFWMDATRSVPVGTPVTQMATVLAPSYANTNGRLEHAGPTGTAHLDGPQISLNPDVPTTFAWTYITQSTAALRSTFYIANLSVGDQVSIWHAGMFVGQLDAKFWRLPEQ